MGALIGVDGKVTIIKPKAGKKYDLAEAQGYVGGYVQRIRVGGKLAMLVDEDGLPKGLPVNAKASALCGLVIVGPAMVIKWTQF
jgi:hypothetical protein